MTREEFKQAMSDLIDNLAPEGELSDESETNLMDNLGECAAEILNSEEDGEAESTSAR